MVFHASRALQCQVYTRCHHVHSARARAFGHCLCPTVTRRVKASMCTNRCIRIGKARPCLRSHALQQESKRKTHDRLPIYCMSVKTIKNGFCAKQIRHEIVTSTRHHQQMNPDLLGFIPGYPAPLGPKWQSQTQKNKSPAAMTRHIPSRLFTYQGQGWVSWGSGKTPVRKLGKDFPEHVIKTRRSTDKPCQMHDPGFEVDEVHRTEGLLSVI